MTRLRLLYLFALTSLLTTTTLAQQLEPCGTVGERSGWLRDFQAQLDDDVRARSVDVTIAIEAHLLAGDQGGEFDYLRAIQTLGALERDFESTGIRFITNLNFDTIYSTAYNDHATVLEGADLMFSNNVDDALNFYFVRNPAGNCGYNLPYAGVAVASQCAGANSKTIAHEVGHALSLPHPFLGWEGGRSYDGSEPAVFSQPAPTSVTYDYTYFQDTLIRDTLIIDTALVELVDRSNCLEAADGFCDTPADYIASRWTCSSGQQSGATQTDPTGATFRSDGSLIMSYSNDACQARFSADQVVAMKAFANTQRSSWIRPAGDTALVRTAVTPAHTDGALLPSADILPFNAPANATHYFVQIASRQSMTSTSIVGEYVTTTPEVALDPNVFEEGRTYYWRAYPFNDHSFQQGLSPRYSFVFPAPVGTQEYQTLDVAAFPNPVAAGNELNLGTRWAYARYSVLNAVGQEVQTGVCTALASLQLSDALASGTHVLILHSATGAVTGRTRIQLLGK